MLFTFVSSDAVAQVRVNSDSSIIYFSGCYHLGGHPEEGILKLNSDRTFQWIKETTHNGTWRTARRQGIPFPATVIILKYENGSKDKFQIWHDPNEIALRDDKRMYQTDCE